MLGCFEGYNAAVLAYGQTGSISLGIQAAKATRWERMYQASVRTNRAFCQE